MAEKPNDSEALQVRGANSPGTLDPLVSGELAALTKAVTRLADVLESGLSQLLARLNVSGAPETRPWAKGDRVKSGGLRGKIASVGAAGIGVLWDNGKYDLLLPAQAKRLVRE